MWMKILEPAVVQPSQEMSRRGESRDWEPPAGIGEPRVQPRVEGPRFTYRGPGEPHWRGQPCYPTSQAGTNPGEQIVAMACGCQASVPWWTLEPRREAD